MYCQYNVRDCYTLITMCNSLKFIIRFKRYYFFAFNIKIYDLYITKKILKHGNKEFQDL